MKCNETVLILNASYTIICLDRPLGIQEVEASIIYRKSSHEGGKVVSPTHRQPLPPQEITLVLISVRGWVDTRAMVRPEALCQWNIPITPVGKILNTNNVSVNPGHPQGNSLHILEGKERSYVELKNKIQLDATYYFIMLTLGSTCFGHHYARRQELTTVALVKLPSSSNSRTRRPMWWPTLSSWTPDDGHNGARNTLSLT